MATATYQNNHIYTYTGSAYNVHATGTKCQTAVTALDHLQSKKFQDTGAHVPSQLIEYLKQEGARELRVAKDRKMRRVIDTKDKKKKQKVLDYQYHRNSGNVNPRDLYRKVYSGGVQYDCSACEMLVAPHGFLSHVAFAQHKERLRMLGKQEDEAFIEQEKLSCQEAERKTAGSFHCDPCGKWVTPQCWLDHAVGKSHLAKIGYPHNTEISSLLGVHDISKILESFKTGSYVPYFAVGEDMWDVSQEYFSAQMGVLKGFQVMFCTADSTNWGTQHHPGLVCSLQADPIASALGVVYKVDKDVLVDISKTKIRPETAIAVLPIDCGGKVVRAVAFIDKTLSKVLPKQAAQRIAGAFGPKGSNYSLVAQLQHEYQKQDWVDDYLVRLKHDAEEVLWPKNTRGSGGVLL
eukprot:TRINITY_DN2607_c2_g1_i2.p1 TRINITY_DN2607_c2_g1~~TRINITY_DN2607_c2_g1_i2.p1  ORF type:complete len:424 (+),score=52.21 TRINITY_DN2607_c2_g1_i2:57-1274(+)